MLSELIKYPMQNHQKIIAFLINSGGVEVKESSDDYNVNIMITQWKEEIKSFGRFVPRGSFAGEIFTF